LIPVVMSGILAVYALVISVLIASDIRPPPQKNYSLYAGFMHMAAGLSVGLSGMAAGYAIGIVGDVVCTEDGMRGQILTGAGRPRIYAAVEDLRGHGADSYFRRSPGVVRVSDRRLPTKAVADVDRLIVALILNTRASG
jgi:F0F1-type ATP synthase membrane subunit c/vacuolar-type H+-ATPase subunit K